MLVKLFHKVIHYDLNILFNSFFFSSSSEHEDSIEDEESSISTDSPMPISKENTAELITFKSLFATMKKAYGTSLKKLCEEDIFIYKK